MKSYMSRAKYEVRASGFVFLFQVGNMISYFTWGSDLNHAAESGTIKMATSA